MRIEWLTTFPSGRTHTHSADDGQTGWRLHAIECGPDTPIAELGRKPAICGTRPGTGWGADLFIDEPCIRCVKSAIKRGLGIPDSVRSAFEVTQDFKRRYRESA